MRRSELLAPPTLALEVFDNCAVAHLFVDGPEVRPVHPVVVEGRVYFHGAKKGEKADWTGRPAVLSAHEIVAEIPSYLRHPERACPATTYYRSGEVSGRLTQVEDPQVKLAVLQRLMTRFQPEGGYRALSLEDPMYAGAIRGVSVVTVDGDPVGRRKLGQDLPDPDRHAVLEGLWRRGAVGDDRAIECIVAAAPDTATLPPLLRGPHGTRLVTRIAAGRVDEAVALVRGEYWNVPWDDAVVAAAMTGSEVWVGVEHAGELVATARAMSDGTKMAYIGDVGVRPDFRSRGVGTAMMRLLLDHPRVRNTRWQALRTRDATVFYERMGFEPARGMAGTVDLCRRPWGWGGPTGPRSAESTGSRTADSSP